MADGKMAAADYINQGIMIINEMVDARGIDKCRMAIEGVKTLDMAKQAADEEEAKLERRIRELEHMLADAKQDDEDPDDGDEECETVGGKTYKFGG